MKEIDLPWAVRDRRTFGFFDDYDWYVTAHRWTSLVADSTPTVTIVSGGAGGQLQLFTDAVNNNEVAAYTTNKIYLMAAAKPLYFETAIQYSEAATSAANIAVGFASAFGANLLVDDGAGPAANFSGALIYKVDGGTQWKFVTSLGTTQTITQSNTTAGGSAFQVLKIDMKPINSTQFECVPVVDGRQLTDSNNKPIKHYITFSGAVAMNAGSYAKAGSGSAETLLVDYTAPYQLR